jgi:prepilin-type N-terminal cleavage/methylation domain-containing protein
MTSAPLVPRPRAFTLIELAMVLVIAAILGAVLLAGARRSRLADGLTQSMANVRQIQVAAAMYHFDHAGQVPMRACGYSNGQITGGWDAWNFGGKNCDTVPGNPFWSGQVFDEPGHSRFLNAYLYPARIPQPNGYVSTGAGSTWTFVHGTPTSAQRASLQVDVCRSPGDVATRQRNWPSPTPGISGYNDIGTSYVQNMAWWDAMPPGTFTQRYNEGARRIGLAFDGANPHFVWLSDQTLEAVGSSSTASIPGEFGKINTSVSAFADGTVRYLKVSPGLLSGPGYTLIP